ncbi:hypothetical protein AOXY_G27257 [Acipenser oxyrinchus oxyrinchus]|uniref:Protein N-terminal asparagine amidohydrolase n=1 Tax=Acipenser oxyrinchus oxyrinchus TaxID=40147 RepID=A0AAD8CQQ5_ACIOX|nr:hypothetical protein AOXY_G27257 [Acipenser oxyrinchus oxyrinchus]
MPLFVNKKKIEDFETIEEFWAKYGDDLRAAAEKFKQMNPETEKMKLLYVSQREYATIDWGTDNICTIGSDEATTCHVIVLHFQGTGIVSLGHIDGSKRGREYPIPQCGFVHGRGFCDNRGISQSNTMKLLKLFMKQEINIYIQLACVSELNDVVHEGNHWPVVYGVGVSFGKNSRFGLGLLDIYPAYFPKENEEVIPQITLRGARLVMDKTVPALFCNDGKKKQMTIGPYDWFWDILKNDDDTRDLTDGEIRRNFSTSPLVEKPEFSQTIKEQYKYLADNVILQSTKNQVLHYILNPEGKWVPT